MTNQQTIRVAYEKALHLALERGLPEDMASNAACADVDSSMEPTQENMIALMAVMDEVKQ